MRALAVAIMLGFAMPAVAAPRDCPPVAGADQLVVAGARVILGEMHGTNETQKVVAALACRATAAAPVRVALEIPSPEQPRLDAYLASAGSAADKQTLLAGAFWTRDFQDGRSSTAMLALVDAVRVLGRQGADIKIVAFDVAEPKPGLDRDLEMAKTLAAHLAREPKATFVGLVGNLHARKAPHPQFKQTFMAERLVAMKQPVTTLDVRYGIGSAWVCMPGCGPQTIGRGAPEPVGVTLKPTGDGAYDGTFSIGTPTFAPPAARPMTAAQKLAVELLPVEAAALQAEGDKQWRVCGERFAELGRRRPANAADSDYNAACCFTRAGDATQAFAQLAAAVDAGFKDRAWLEKDGDLAPLHGDPRWAKLLARLPATPPKQ